MSVEALTYRLELRGKTVGSHVLRRQYRNSETYLEGRLSLQGALGNVAVTQLSRCGREDAVSFEFRERNEDQGGTREFQVTFDAEAGLVRAQRNADERAETPYLVPFRDPLSLLQEVRTRRDTETPWRVPMLGKDVWVFPAGEEEIAWAGGPPQRAQRYLLRPGDARLWVARDEDRTILRFAQRVQDHYLEAHLMQRGVEAHSDAWDAFEGEAPGKRSRRRRRRRRRKRSRGRSRG